MSAQSDNNLALRLAQAEEQVKKLLGVVENLKTELTQKNKAVHATDNTIHNAFINNQSQNQSSITLNADSIVNVPQVPIGEIWPFQENSGIDWTDLSLFDDINNFENELTRNYNDQIICDLVEEVPNTAIASNHLKHSRDEPIDAIRGESSREIKAMRHDSLDRILNYTVQASSVSEKDLIHIDLNTNYDEERKSISDKIFQYMNNGDMNRLAKFVSDYVCDALTMHYCHIPDIIQGKAELMMLFSLLYETYPDSIRKVLSTNINNKVIIYEYMFTGTSMFDTPLAVSFHQVKEHEYRSKYSENAEEYILHQNILRNVAEYNPKHYNDASFNDTLFSAGMVNKETCYYPTGIIYATSSITTSPITSTTTSASDSTSGDIINTSVLKESPVNFPSVANSSGDVIRLPRSKGREALRLDATRPGSFTLGSETRTHSYPMHTTTDTTSSSSSSSSSHSTLTGIGGWLAHLSPAISSHSTYSTTATTTPTTSCSTTATSNIYQRSRPQSLNSAMMTNALLSKTLEAERRRMEVTFNDYNRIIQIVISPATR